MCQLIIELLGVDNKRSQKLLIFETEFKNYSIFDMGETSENVSPAQDYVFVFWDA